MPAEKNPPADDTSAREILFSRVFDAPRDLVWNAMTDPQHVVQWWGPRGFRTQITSMDVRAGGTWEHTMIGPDGVRYPNKSIFLEVVRLERIVYSHGGQREGGPGAHFVATWTFEELGPKRTQVTGRMVFPSKAARDFVAKEFGAVEGARDTLERLGEMLANSGAQGQPFIISREFDAPRDLVFKAFTERDHLMRWSAPKGCEVVSCTLDLRPGGSLHTCMRLPNGAEMWGKYIYREITPPERLVYINTFSNAAGEITRHPMSPNWPPEMLTTITFAERNGRTNVTIQWVPINAGDTEWKTFDDGRVSMSGGWNGSLDQLQDHLKTLR